jgi:PAS domain S-box-containing protein
LVWTLLWQWEDMQNASLIHRSSAVLRLAILALGLAWVTGAKPAETSPEGAPTITRAAQARALSAAEARQGYRARLRGVVTFSDPVKGLLFVQDDSGSVYVSPQPPAVDWPPGQRVEVTGVIAPGSHVPYVSQAVLQDLGPGALPPAPPVTFTRLASNSEDGNWVEIHGVVRTAGIIKGQATLEIAAEGRRLVAFIAGLPPTGEDLAGLVDAEVRVRGVAGLADKDPTSRVFLDAHVPNFSCLVVTTPAPANPIREAVRPLASLLPATPAGEFTHRVRTRGTLTLGPEETWQLRDATGSLVVQAGQPLLAPTNVEVEVLGFPSHPAAGPALEDTVVYLPAWPQDAAAPEAALRPVLTRVETLRNLSPEEARRGYPIWLQGVITYADPDSLFIQDATSGIAISDPAHRFTGAAGQAVTVAGYSGMGAYAPIVREPQFHLTGPGRPPAAKPVTLDQLKSGAEDGQRVELQGVVRYVTTERGLLALTLGTSGGSVKVLVYNPRGDPLPSHLVDAEVQWRGVCDTVVNKERQRTGYRLLTADLADLRLAKPAPADPFGLAAQPISRLFQYQPAGDRRHRVHVRGQVLFRDPQWCTLFLQEGSASLYVLTLDPPANLVLGDQAEAVGFFRQETFGPVMTEAVVKRISPGALGPPMDVTIDQAISGDFQSRLIRLAARLVDRIPGAGGRGLILQAGEWRFTALLESTQDPAALDAIRLGSQVRLTGICRLEDSQGEGGGQALRLQLRTAADVAVLQRPPLFSTRSWMAAAGLAGVFFAATAGWVVLLRRNARAQTEIIRRDLARQAALESEYRELFSQVNDLIQSLHPDGRLARANPAWLRTLGYTEADLPRLTFADILHPEDAPRGESWLQDALAGKKLDQVSARFRRRDGQVIEVEGNFSATAKAGQLAVIRSIFRDVTQRKRAEAALQKATRQLTNIIEFLPDATFVIGPDKKIIAWNHACELLTGVDKRAMLGQGEYAYAEPLYGERRPVLIDLLDQPEAEAKEHYKYLRREGNKLYAEIFDTRLRGGHGAYLWGVASPLYDEAGNRCGAIEVIRDITELKRVERALLEKERKYRELVEHANSIILRWNSEGQITFLNEYGLRFFGYAAEEIFGRQMLGTITPLTESGGRDLSTLVAQIVANPKAYEQHVNENVRRDGERVWVSWANRIERDNQGQVVEILSVGADITARRQAEEALRQSEEQFRVIMENLEDLVSMNDLHGVRLYASPSLIRLMGGPERTLGAPFYQSIVPEDQPLARQAFWETARAGEGRRFLFRHTDPRGGIRQIESQTSAIRGPRGEVARVLIVSRDVTERHQAEAAIRELNATLERRVAERTAELAVARDRAEESDRLKSAFLATMSHELRTPLNSIIGFTGILLQGLAGPLNPEQRKQLEMVRDSARHLLALINDVLDISKIEAGQLTVSREPFDLRAAVEQAARLVAPLAAKKGLALRVTVEPGVGELLSDRRRVEQVLLNLLNNAVKFTERGEIALAAARLPAAPGAAPSYEIRVTDTGIGIRPEDLANLFLPFRQVDTGLSRQHEGTGLGLAICRRLVELLGGRIHAESQWGQGSVFRFTLPSPPDSPAPAHAPLP